MKSLTRLANDYLALRRSLGFKLFGAEGVLHRFLAYMEQEHHTHITADAVLKWVHTGNLSPMTISGRFTLLRKFAEYAHAIDEAHEIPAARLVLNPKGHSSYLQSGTDITDPLWLSHTPLRRQRTAAQHVLHSSRALGRHRHAHQ